MQYRDYLKTEQWKNRRKEILVRDGNKCSECGDKKKLQVHHLNYKNLGCEKDEDLVTLCGNCHKKIGVKPPVFFDNPVYGKSIKYDKNGYFSNVPEELLVGGMVSTDKQFSKLFQYEDPKLSKSSYYKYWYNICRNISQNTNIIISRNPKLHYISEICEFEKICESSKFVNYRFIKECKDKGLIATFELKEQKVFVANPRYTLNGKYYPKLIADLFDELDKVGDK